MSKITDHLIAQNDTSGFTPDGSKVERLSKLHFHRDFNTKPLRSFAIVHITMVGIVYKIEDEYRYKITTADDADPWVASFNTEQEAEEDRALLIRKMEMWQ